MAWPYHFVDLTDAQKLERRELLDKYANLAQLSVLVPLLAIQCYHFLFWVGRRQDGEDSPGSPRRKEERLGHQIGIARAKTLWRKTGWWCGEPVDIGNFHLGSRDEVLFAGTWLVWLLFLCFPQTGDDYLHLTKRFGIVAASQLPLHYLLAIKSPYSPLQILTRRSHETLNTFHQLLGRVILILLYLHVAFYLNFYIQKDLLASKIQEAYIICGILGIISLTAIGTTALEPIRRWSYRVFYTVHILLAGLILCILPFHVSHIRLYVYEAIAIYALNVALRSWNTMKVSASIKRLVNANLIEINIPLSPSSKQSDLQRYTQAGQHAYISLNNHPRAQVLRKNPFSVASIPSTDGNLRFIARALKGNTALLAEEANSARDSTRLVNIEGPYGIKHSENLLHYDRILFVAGGVGGTFIVPLYRQLLADLSPSKGSYRRQKVTFVWIARTMADVVWALPGDDNEREGFVERLNVYLTGGSMGDNAASNGPISNPEQDSWSEDGIELEERKNLLTNDSNSDQPKDSNSLNVRAGRPDLRRVVGDTISQSSHERVAVFVCGPESLSRGLRAELHKWGVKGRDIFYWEEKFAL